MRAKKADAATATAERDRQIRAGCAKCLSYHRQKSARETLAALARHPLAEQLPDLYGSGGAVKVPYRTFNHTLSTTETTALEPGIQERKYYAPGIGEIASRDISGGSHESFQLVSVKG